MVRFEGNIEAVHLDATNVTWPSVECSLASVFLLVRSCDAVASATVGTPVVSLLTVSAMRRFFWTVKLSSSVELTYTSHINT